MTLVNIYRTLAKVIGRQSFEAYDTSNAQPIMELLSAVNGPQASRHYLGTPILAMCEDTRRSVGGYITFNMNSPISWLSKKFPITTLSSTEAEYIALCHLIQELMYLRQLATELELNVTTTVPVYEDNQSTIKMTNNSDQHGRSKHIDIRHYFVNKMSNQKNSLLNMLTHMT